MWGYTVQPWLLAVPSDSPTIFDKIINKEIPADIIFEDDKVLAFRDINPQAPVHILLIPKVRDGLTGLSKAEEKNCDALGRLLYTTKLVTKQEGLLENGFRLVINDGPNGCQSVYHRSSPSPSRGTTDELATWLKNVETNSRVHPIIYVC
ncbi:hypothetical protein KY284_007757 [Solanum tuberosum]|nr:hypothetical protein KY284_007757 [Solanum tuberosum]